MIAKNNSAAGSAGAASFTRRAFTLVEIMLALAISSVVMFGCTALMFDMMRLAEFFEKGDSFKTHIDGVEKFLRGAIMNSEVENAALFESVLAKNTAQTIYLARDFEEKSDDKYYIGYGVGTEHPFYPSALGFSGDKLCLLEVFEDGLYVVWRFVSPELVGDDAAIYKTLLSPWVKKISYLYFDNNSWKEEDDIKTMGYSDMMPKYIKVYFDKNGETHQRIIPLNFYLDFQISQ